MTDKLINNETAKKIAIDCFNSTWDLIDKPEKTADDKIEMIRLAHASLYFWQLVENHTPTNLSIGYWQLSRVYSLIEDGQSAVLFGNKCIEISLQDSVDAFYLAYGYEAVARGLIIEKSYDQARANIQIAQKSLLDSKETELDMLKNELEELEKQCTVD